MNLLFSLTTKPTIVKKPHTVALESVGVVVAATRKPFPNIKQKLRLASSTLICTGLPAISFAEAQDLDVKATSVYYFEEEGINVKENVIRAKKEIGDESFVSATYIIDVMSGPSPTGAATLNQPQTFTTPSGSNIVIPSGERPRLEFKDTRQAILLNYSRPINALLKTQIGVSYSTEEDYESVGLSTVFLYDTNQKHTTFETGISANYDNITPVGGTPNTLASTQMATTTGVNNKRKIDGLLGVTQILNRFSLIQANLTLSHSNGYHTDPYKMFSLLDSDLNPIPTHSYFREKRPDTRNTSILYLRHILNLSQNTFNTRFRFFKDDWDINSYTLDSLYTYEFSNNQQIQLHGRYYLQSRAKFYHPYIATGYGNDIEDRDVILINTSNPLSLENNIDYVSADSRLSHFYSYTLGIKYSKRFSQFDSKLDIRLDHIRQYEKKSGASLLRAWIAQIAIKLLY